LVPWGLSQDYVVRINLVGQAGSSIQPVRQSSHLNHRFAGAPESTLIRTDFYRSGWA
jgi:hypothetical protein